MKIKTKQTVQLSQNTLDSSYKPTIYKEYVFINNVCLIVEV